MWFAVIILNSFNVCIELMQYLVAICWFFYIFQVSMLCWTRICFSPSPFPYWVIISWFTEYQLENGDFNFLLTSHSSSRFISYDISSFFLVDFLSTAFHNELIYLPILQFHHLFFLYFNKNLSFQFLRLRHFGVILGFSFSPVLHIWAGNNSYLFHLQNIAGILSS